MRLERFPEFGEPPRYVETLRAAGFQLAAALLFIALVAVGNLVLVSTDAAETTHEALRGGWRGVLTLALGPPRIGVQIGHDGVAAHPDELGHLRGNTGGYADGLSELVVNKSVARALKEGLEAQGVAVDLLRATPPAGYHADLMLSLHADSVYDPARQGYKSSHFNPPRSTLEPRLKRLIDAAYLGATSLPDDTPNTTDAMRHYYAFNFRSYEHAAHPATPALIVELGYLSNPADAALLRRPKQVAAALSGGVLTFLRERNRLP
ncbi:MAG: N-acetylmuramoyl-L-alanine amidase [uncultured Truepera sp.]|uniref:N-acetylmuramoyl-L-alanine amidase n=1 Tax=uncultured Truepera sp. TaxID=543023 RepID=A0A6J4VSD0_9DEIN|nr:MAG: N-acetylmuramoyl-L-alanine amidase [uncultured Truepera sp.]